MKKKIGFLALFIAILMCFFTVSAFATGEESGNSQIPFVDSEQISPNQPDIQTEADLIEEFEEIFGEGSGKILSIAMVGVFVSMLFFPALVVVIVFGVLNSKTKKKIKEYERFFGPLSNNMPITNPDIKGSPYGMPYYAPSGSPMGKNPGSDPFNNEGGQF